MCTTSVLLRLVVWQTNSQHIPMTKTHENTTTGDSIPWFGAKSGVQVWSLPLYYQPKKCTVKWCYCGKSIKMWLSICIFWFSTRIWKFNVIIPVCFGVPRSTPTTTPSFPDLVEAPFLSQPGRPALAWPTWWRRGEAMASVEGTGSVYPQVSHEKKTLLHLLLSIESWLVYRDSYSGLLQSLYQKG